MFIGASMLPEYFKAKVHSFTALAPIVRLEHTTNKLYQYASQYLPLFTWGIQTFGIYDIFPMNEISTWYNAEFCFIFPRYCDFSKERFVPWNVGIDNQKRYPDLYAHVPAGSGWKNLIHYG